VKGERDVRVRTLLKIPANLSAAEHERASRMLEDEKLDGLELSSYGSAYGPVWDPQGSYELDFLRHYRGLRSLHVGVRLVSLASLESVAETLEMLSLSNPPGREYSIDLGPVLSCRKLCAFGSAWRGLDYRLLTEIAGMREFGVTGGGQDRIALAASFSELRKFNLSFGSAKTLRGAEALEKLAHFSSLRVQGLSDLSALTSARQLRFVELESLKQVRALPDLSGQQELTTVLCSTMNGLESLEGLAGSGVRELAFIGCPKLDESSFRKLSQTLPQLERLVVWLGNERQSTAAKRHFDPKVLVGSTNEFERYYEDYTRTEYRAFASS
jgi:hypothetical protein